MRGAVLGVGDLDGDDGGRAGAVLVVRVVPGGELGRQGGVGRVSEEGKLELHLLTEFH